MITNAGTGSIYDVIVVGAGPSGSTLAYDLSSRGVSVCLIEKAALPRYKPCGGGLLYKAASLLDFDISQLVEDVTYGISFTCNLKDEFVQVYDEPLIYMLMRDSFDWHLVERAVAAGTNLLQSHRVTRITFHNDSVAVATDRQKEVRGQIVVGADGARSIVSKTLGADRQFSKLVAIQSEVPVSPAALQHFKGKAWIDWCTIPGGYSWVFPKADHLSVGVGAPPEFGKQLRSFHAKWLAANQLPVVNGGKKYGHILRMRSDHSAPLSFRRALLVGEAAGLVDSFTGEGLSYALKSAHIASGTIEEALSGGLSCLGSYTGRINAEFRRELATAELLLKLFNLMPRQIHTYLKRDRPWNAVARILRGEKNYYSLEQKLGLLHFMLAPLRLASDKSYNRKIRKLGDGTYFGKTNWIE